MTPEPMPEPEGPEDERFVYVVTAAGVEAVREGRWWWISEREALPAARPPAERLLDPAHSAGQDA